MRKPGFCLGENKGADQLRSNCEADQRLQSGKHARAMKPLEPHFYIKKLGFAGVYLFFLFLLQNIDCGYSLEPPRCEVVLTCTHNLCFEQK